MKVVAALACRVQSRRLYAKPLQFIDIDQEISILEYLVSSLKANKQIDEIVLAVSEGEENTPFYRLAEKMGVRYIVGSQHDVQLRMIKAVDLAGGDIIYRVTTECPFIYMDNFSDVLKAHIENKAALTVIEGLPEGTYYELIDVAKLKQSHRECGPEYRTEFCTLYMFRNPDKFFLQRLTVPHSALKRPDIRLTVDYPEDLIVVREVYKALYKKGSFINVAEIIRLLDSKPSLKAVNGWIDAGAGRIWD